MINICKNLILNSVCNTLNYYLFCYNNNRCNLNIRKISYKMIKFDYTNVGQDVVGYDNGIDIDFEIVNYSEKITEIIRYLFSQNENKDFGFNDFNFVNEQILSILEYAKMVRGKFETIAVIGSADSLSCIQALFQALLMPYWNSLDSDERNNFPKIDLISNIDPDEINGLSSIRNLKKTLIITVSAKEPTPEMMSVFMLAKKKLEDEIGENYRMHMVVCAGFGAGVLKQLANQEGYKTFEFPSNISGIFSLISPCTLLPLALLGIDIQEFFAGIQDSFNNMKNEDIRQNESAKTALIHYLLYSQKGKNFFVFMPYSSRLKSFSDWCCQIKSNILAQACDKNGKNVEIGQIPYNALGCTDQYTLLKMFNQGLNNKVINIIKVETFDTDSIVPNFFDYTAAGYLGGKSLAELMNAEVNAAKMTLVDNQRPNITITLSKVFPYELGQFMAWYIGVILIQACLYNLNPFERSDSDMLLNYIYAQMGRYGYEATYQEIQNKLKKEIIMT